jgi:hypothetical protein
MADHVTMTESHFNKLEREAKAAREAGLHGEAAWLTLKKHKSPLMVIGAAGVGWWLLQTDTINNLSFFKDHWWLKGALLMIIGWWLWKKQNPYAQVVLALGVVQLIDSYKAHKKEQEKEKEAGGAKKGKDASGPDESGWDTGWEGRYRWGGEAAGGEDPVLTGSERTVEMADRIFRGAVAA